MLNNKDYMITSHRYHTPPYDWSMGIFQKFKPISGNFRIGDNFSGDLIGVNNQSGRGYYANPLGYWERVNNQFNPGTIKHDIKKDGSIKISEELDAKLKHISQYLKKAKSILISEK